MSLEVAIQENTAALREVLAAIQSMPLSAMRTITVDTGVAASAENLKKETVAVVTRAAPKPEAKPAPEKKAEPVAEAAPDLQYERDIKPAVLKLATETSRQTVLDVLSRFGVPRADALKPDQWPQLLEDIAAARAAFLAAAESVA